MAHVETVQVRYRRKGYAVDDWETAHVDWRDGEQLRKLLLAGIRRRGWSPPEAWAAEWELEVRWPAEGTRLTTFGGAA